MLNWSIHEYLLENSGENAEQVILKFEFKNPDEICKFDGNSWSKLNSFLAKITTKEIRDRAFLLRGFFLKTSVWFEPIDLSTQSILAINQTKTHTITITNIFRNHSNWKDKSPFGAKKMRNFNFPHYTFVYIQVELASSLVWRCRKKINNLIIPWINFKFNCHIIIDTVNFRLLNQFVLFTIVFVFFISVLTRFKFMVVTHQTA